MINQQDPPNLEDALLAQVLHDYALTTFVDISSIVTALEKKETTLKQVCCRIQPEFIREAISHAQTLIIEKSRKLGPDGDADDIADLAWYADNFEGLLVECENIFTTDKNI